MTTDEAYARLRDIVQQGDVVALVGAGLSTDSGIPDYRGEGTRRRARSPVKFNTFVRDPVARRRYWARSVIGWPRMASARPNAGHRALAALEAAGLVTGVLTQNVDGLHQAAGSSKVIELHGGLDHVRCLDCQVLESRDSLQARLLEMNPAFASFTAEMAPDGDADLPDELVLGFEVANCKLCGGPLKPDVVFFGESVPRPRVEEAYRWVEGARACVVLGSSLAVLSGLRFVRRAHERGAPVAIVNRGPTRGDDLAQIKLQDGLSEVLERLARDVAGAGR